MHSSQYSQRLIQSCTPHHPHNYTQRTHGKVGKPSKYGGVWGFHGGEFKDDSLLGNCAL